MKNKIYTIKDAINDQNKLRKEIYHLKLYIANQNILIGAKECLENKTQMNPEWVIKTLNYENFSL